MSCTVRSFAIHTQSPYSQPHKTHGVHTASPPQGTRGAYSPPQSNSEQSQAMLRTMIEGLGAKSSHASDDDGGQYEGPPI